MKDNREVVEGPLKSFLILGSLAIWFAAICYAAWH